MQSTIKDNVEMTMLMKHILSTRKELGLKRNQFKHGITFFFLIKFIHLFAIPFRMS